MYMCVKRPKQYRKNNSSEAYSTYCHYFNIFKRSDWLYRVVHLALCRYGHYVFFVHHHPNERSFWHTAAFHRAHRRQVCSQNEFMSYRPTYSDVWVYESRCDAASTVSKVDMELICRKMLKKVRSSKNSACLFNSFAANYFQQLLTYDGPFSPCQWQYRW